MKLEWDFSELESFAERLANESVFNRYCEQITKQIAEELRKKLKENTPKRTGHLASGWGNQAFIVTPTANGFEVELTNNVEYALWVNDGHYSYNQFNKGGAPYVVKNRTVPYTQGNREDTFVYGRFFVEKSILETEENVSELHKIIYTQLKSWFGWCVNGK